MLWTGIAAAQVYVANTLLGTVSVISTPGNTVVATIPVGTQPTAVTITPNGQFVYVANRPAGTVSKIATATNTVVNTIFVGAVARGVRVSPDGNSLFVAAGSSLFRFSVANDQPTGTFPLPANPNSPVPIDVDITPDGQFAYVVDNATAICSVDPINLATGAVLTSVQCANQFGLMGALVGSFPRGVAVRPDGQFVYATAYQDGAVHTVRVSDNSYAGGACAGTFGCIGAGPQGIVISPNSQFAYTTNITENKVAIFPLSPFGPPGLPSAHVSLPSSPAAYLDITPDGRFLYVTHGASFVSVIDLLAIPPSVVQTITVGVNSFPQGIAVSPLASSGPPPPPPPPSPPALSASIVATPTSVTVGDSFTVTMTVSNTGGSAASNVVPSALTVGGDGGASQTSGPSPASATINAGGSQPFTFTYSASVAGSVTFSGSASGGGVGSATATSNGVTIAAAPSPPTLSVGPANLNFTGEQGLADPPSQSLTIGNAGSGTLTWNAAGSAGDGLNWLGLNPGSGVAPPPASPAVSSRTCGLVAGNYSGSITVTSPGAAGSPQSTAVTLSVTPPAGLLSVPSARICTNQAAYHPGDLLRLSASLRQGAGSNSGDAYVFAQVPGTSTFVSLVLSQGLIVPVAGPAPVPLATNFSMFDFAGEVFSRPFDAGDPEGSYTVTAVLALSNSDPLVPANQLATATTSFTVTH
jgi:YVTN family beta-propeller protein